MRDPQWKLLWLIEWVGDRVAKHDVLQKLPNKYNRFRTEMIAFDQPADQVVKIMASSRVSTFLFAATAAMLLTGAAIAGVSDTSLADRGHAIAAEHCSACHAIGRDDESPTPTNANTAFRDLGKRFPIKMLQDAARCCQHGAD
ncbi:MAG: hypothetical protein K0U74_00015 [Alphaproteobacteria bacterium]|nr:hypothetical protein [Alphaproteobacteria bacterium]